MGLNCHCENCGTLISLLRHYKNCIMTWDDNSTKHILMWMLTAKRHNSYKFNLRAIQVNQMLTDWHIYLLLLHWLYRSHWLQANVLHHAHALSITAPCFWQLTVLYLPGDDSYVVIDIIWWLPPNNESWLCKYIILYQHKT